ncbi:hypothetical protein [Streptomyces sp. CB03911]|uniref:hypothetical protein n=1 Tax=Streptomyces sp. CB03911 TaxID=1804758 RepID=UPI0018FEC2F0|nr:hypothetical protein [Streptomyces sp. CB03911]
MPDLRTRFSRLTPAQRLAGAGGAAVVFAGGISGIMWIATDHPPRCARPEVHATLGMGAQEQCLEDVGNWCEANYPSDVGPAGCMLKVFGYDARPLGSDD